MHGNFAISERSTCNYEKIVFELKNILDDQFDIEMLNDGDFVCFRTEGKKAQTLSSNFSTGEVYTKEEIKEIREYIQRIVSQINVPPRYVKDREKIIYAQIAQVLSKIMDFDNEGDRVIDESRELNYYTLPLDIVQTINETQNLKGLVKGKSICGGMSILMVILPLYFGINSKKIAGKPEEDGKSHAWNLVTLDGDTFEDDFTCYFENLKSGLIPQIVTFLLGKDESGRKMGKLSYHKTDVDMQLSEDISKTEMINLLGTDWSQVKDWSKVNIHRPNSLATFSEQLVTWAHMVRSNMLKRLSGINVISGEENEGRD